MLKMLLISYKDTVQGWKQLIKKKSNIKNVPQLKTATTGSAAGESKLDPSSVCFPKEGHMAWKGSHWTQAAAEELLQSAPRDSPGAGAWEENPLIAHQTSSKTNFRMSWGAHE